MNFKNLNVKECPVCGCSIVVLESVETSYNKIREHANGQRWEHIRFLCGQEIIWIPNYCSWEPSPLYKCENNPQRQAELAKREEAWEKLDQFVDTLDVDSRTKKTMKSRY